MANLDYVPFPELDTGGNISYIQYDNNQTAITNLNYVEWANILSNPLQSNATNDIIYRGNRIGIGMYENQIPVSKLHLIGDLFITENEDTWDCLRFYHTGNIAYQDFGGCEDGVSFRMNTGTVSFENNPSFTEIMRFRNNKIGILNNNPQYSFDINGSLNSTSLYVNDVSLNTIVNTLINDRNYLTISTASLTYATITNLSTKENALTFSSPLTRNADNISINLSSYATTSQLATKQDVLSNATVLLGNGSNITNLNYNNIPNRPDLSTYATTSQLATKQDVLSNATVLLGNGSNITNLNYNNIPNRPDLSTYATTSQLTTKQDVLSNATVLLGNGSNITNLNYNNIPNRPDLSTYATTSQLTTKQDVLSNATVLLGNGSNITNLNYNNIPNRPDLSTYDTIALRNTALSSYITTANANALNSRFFNNNGNGHTTYTDFNSPTQFGYNYIQGTANGPGVSSSGQYYSWSIGLGSQYAYGTYGVQFALPRNTQNPYLCVRFQENSAFSPWNKISAVYAESAGTVSYANITGTPNLSIYATTTQLTTKQDVLSNATVLLGNGSNISNLNYDNIPNKPDLSTYATITNLNTKENALTFSAPLTRTTNTISLDLSGYLTSSTASTTYATITNLNTKENALTFSAPLTRTTNTISLDLSAYDTIALRNTALSSYLTSATASTTYATITNLNTKENTLTFSAPLTRTTNTISLDLSGYLTTSTASSTYATITNLNTKENALTFSAPLTRTTNTISLDLSGYITTANANLLNNRFFNNNGNNHGNYTDFNSPTQFGYNYIGGTTNSPNVNGAGQYYSWDIGLGANYGFGTYRAQFALPRNVANPYLCVRYQENGAYTGWNRISAGYADSAGDLSAGTKLIQGGLNLTATNPAVYFQGGTSALGYASSAGAYSGSANAGDLVLRSDTNQALILQSGAGGYALAVNTNNTVSFSGQILLPSSWRFIVGTYGGSANSLGLVNANNNSVWYYRGTQTNINQDISDIRTKNNIENIDNSLTLINQLEPKKYIKLVDRDEIKEYGFIAQDIEKVVPEVVYNEPYYIPNIYEDCEFDNRTKCFISTKDQSLILTVGTKIKIVLDKKDGENDINNIHTKWCCMETEIIEVIDEFTFKIKDDADINETEIFVYGTLKEDFKTIDYKSLHAINIQATKDLYAIIKDLQERIRILENK